ncbi:lysosome-associated membrane glycoprotein 1 [Plakobranchus ocellatus]|uniref:Lysosome-associated membrane glycoprotein 1 n=1 Tax=Plakobranchus ocellatus TaxID=259542 RepID=A0AAV3XSQ3_9GAST|nr:lysosome-associated membrane glycoprotein 1 [Plakobranchus ocellatus]
MSDLAQPSTTRDPHSSCFSVKKMTSTFYRYLECVYEIRTVHNKVWNLNLKFYENFSLRGFVLYKSIAVAC